MNKYFFPAVFIFANNEIITLMALTVMLGMLIYDLLTWMADGKW